MKPYHKILIQECGEPLVPIPLELFAVESPHPYEKLGADYEGRSPYYLREGVLDALIQAQKRLEQKHPGWRIQIFDAYRPLAVQQFMVNYTFADLIRQRGLKAEELSSQEKNKLWQKIYQLWAVPSHDPATPPPHSTGAAVDVTLVDENGEVVDMGSPIDELSGRSHPQHYANSTDPKEQQYHLNRELLLEIMKESGFGRHLVEWWHFSLGDQMWAWQQNSHNPANLLTAYYGKL